MSQTWIVTGADRAEGTDLSIEIEAADEAQARRRANRRGLLVKSAAPAPAVAHDDEEDQSKELLDLAMQDEDSPGEASGPVRYASPAIGTIGRRGTPPPFFFALAAFPILCYVVAGLAILSAVYWIVQAAGAAADDGPPASELAAAYRAGAFGAAFTLTAASVGAAGLFGTIGGAGHALRLHVMRHWNSR